MSERIYRESVLGQSLVEALEELDEEIRLNAPQSSAFNTTAVSGAGTVASPAIGAYSKKSLHEDCLRELELATEKAFSKMDGQDSDVYA